MYQLNIEYPLFSKARPRLTKTGHAYMPPAYKNHQRNLRAAIRCQWGDNPILEEPIMLQLMVYGESRGDVDNIAGAFMDAAQGIVYIDDNCRIVTRLDVQWHLSKKSESRWLVRVTPYSCL